MGNAYSSSVYGSDYEPAFLIRKPIVPNLRKIVMAAPDDLGDL
jgi:hypothetical protein